MNQGGNGKRQINEIVKEENIANSVQEYSEQWHLMFNNQVSRWSAKAIKYIHIHMHTYGECNLNSIARVEMNEDKAELCQYHSSYCCSSI